MQMHCPDVSRVNEQMAMQWCSHPRNINLKGSHLLWIQHMSIQVHPTMEHHNNSNSASHRAIKTDPFLHTPISDTLYRNKLNGRNTLPKQQFISFMKRQKHAAERKFDPAETRRRNKIWSVFDASYISTQSSRIMRYRQHLIPRYSPPSPTTRN